MPEERLGYAEVRIFPVFRRMGQQASHHGGGQEVGEDICGVSGDEGRWRAFVINKRNSDESPMKSIDKERYEMYD